MGIFNLKISTEFAPGAKESLFGSVTTTPIVRDGTGENDWFNGGAGNDEFYGYGGNDWASGGNGIDTFNGGAGNDTLYGDGGGDVLRGGADDDFISGGSGGDQIEGGSGNDRLYGGADNDALLGGAGNDTMTGGTGRDTFDFSSAEDRAGGERDVVTDFTAEDTLTLSASGVLSTRSFEYWTGDPSMPESTQINTMLIITNTDMSTHSIIFENTTADLLAMHTNYV